MLTETDLRNFIYDPNRIQSTILNYIEQATNGETTIVDPTNPFAFLLEATAVNASNPLIEMKNNLKRLYPFLATDKKDLYPHLTDSLLVNMFATPAEANIVFYINVMELKQNGYRPEDASYTEVIVPEYTEVIVANTYFTLLNDVSVKYYDEGTIFIEQKISDSDIAVNGIGVINGVIVTDSSANKWILFETVLKQVKRTSVSDTIIAAEGYDKNIGITDQYYYANLSYKNNNTFDEEGNNVYVNLNKIHDDSYIDPYTPSVYITQATGMINFKIPDVYLVDGGVSANSRISVYETKGKIFLPINNYKFEDFAINLGNIGKTPQSSVSPNITILTTSRDVVDGGKNALTADEIKDSIINNTMGDLNLPITDLGIKRMGTFNGYEIFKALDTVTDRTYIASKNSSDINSQLINSRADIFANTAKILVSELISDTLTMATINRNIFIDDNILIIKSGAVFKEVNNVITLVNDNELDIIKYLTDANKISYFKLNKYFYTPYYYVLDKIDTMVSSRVYDLDNPVMNNLKIIGKNNNISIVANTDQYIMAKTDIGYRITMSAIGNDIFKSLDPTSIRAQLKIPLTNDIEAVYYEALYDSTTGYFVFEIATDNYITNDDTLLITNGVSGITNKFINLINKATIIIFKTGTINEDSTNYNINELFISRDNTSTVISIEEVDLKFGSKIDYIWNKIYNEYSERKYLRYTNPVYSYYTEDVYEINPDTGTIFTATSTYQVTDVMITLIAAHTYVLTINSVPYTYTAVAGDTVADIQDGIILAIVTESVHASVIPNGVRLTGYVKGVNFSLITDSGLTYNTTTQANSELTYNLIHAKGDPVLDINGDPVLKYAIGDVVIDPINGLPKIDQDNGVVRYIDILMLEYEYKIATSRLYKNYNKLLMESLQTWLLSQLPDLNNSTLENTSILFKSYKSAIPVTVVIGKTRHSVSYKVRPKVSIYVNRDAYTYDELNAIRNKIGSIIHNHLDSTYISLNNIKSDIINTIDKNIVGVKITGLDNLGDLEAFNIYDKTTRLTIDKVMELDSNNELIVNYAIDLNIQKI